MIRRLTVQTFATIPLTLSILLCAPAQAADAPTATNAPAAPPPIVRSAAKIPTEAFSQPNFVRLVDLSPDGKHLAGLVSHDGAIKIMIMPIYADPNDKSVLLTVPDKIEINNISWVNNDNIVVGVHALIDVTGARQWQVSRVFAVNRATGNIKKLQWDLGGQSAQVIWSAHNGKPEVLISEQNTIYTNRDGFWPSVYRVNIENDHATKEVDGQTGIINWVADSTGLVRAGVNFDDDSLTAHLLYRNSSHALFRTIDRANIKNRQHLIYPFLFLPNSEHALVLESDELGQQTISDYDMSTVNKTGSIFTSDIHSDLRPIFSNGESSLLGVHQSLGRLKWLDPKFAEIQAQLDKAVPNARVHIASWSDDRNKLLVQISDADMPGSLYFYDTNEGTLHRISLMNAAIGNQHLAETKMMTYKARDGLEIEAKVTMPTGRAPKNLPLIMLPHGGPWGHDDMNYDFLPQFLANRGYMVIQPNFRGSDGYGQGFERKGEGQMGLAMQDDISDGLKWAVDKGLADSKRTCIFGRDYGGYAAMWGLVKDPDQYRCAISMAGVSSLKREVYGFGEIVNQNKYRLDWKRMTPDFDAVSPINFVAKIKAPLLLIHGKKDIRVDYKNSEKMYDAMKAAGKAVELVPLPLADHSAERQADRLTLLSSIEAFLKKYNPAD